MTARHFAAGTLSGIGLLAIGMLAIGLLAFATPAQSGAGGDGSRKTPKAELPKPSYILREQGVVEITFRSDGTQSERIVPASEIKALRASDKIAKIHAGTLFTAAVSTRPRHLAPGERGVLHVFVLLEADAVVLPGTTWSLDVFRDKLPIELGTPVLVEASKGAQKTRFAGRPVYDDVLEIRTPIRIRADAAMARYPIAGHVELEVHRGATGDLVGVFYCGLEGWLTVGRSLRTRQAGKGGASQDGGPGGPSGANAERNPRTAVRDGAANRVDADSPTGDGSSNGVDAPGERPGQTPSALSSRILLYGVGGVVFLVVLLWLVGRSRD